MAGIDNNKVFEEARIKLRALMEANFLISLTNAAYQLLTDAKLGAGYHNLTGNTLTSLSVGIYSNMRLVRLLNISDVLSLNPPTRKKLSRGNGKGNVRVWDYDTGELLSIKKADLMNTDGGYGKDSSISFLQAYTPTFKGWCLVMCTGTEYSTFLESEKGLNVLTDTQRISVNVVLSNLIRIT